VGSGVGSFLREYIPNNANVRKVSYFSGIWDLLKLFCCLSEVACWMVTGERQAARIRGTYLKTILRQDVAFFDKETNTGEVVGRMSGDTVLIQDAMGEKVLNCSCTLTRRKNYSGFYTYCHVFVVR